MYRRWRIVWFLGCWLVVLSRCPASEYPVEKWQAWLGHSKDFYPGRSWTKFATPEEAGWSGDKLRQAREYFDKIDSAAVMVVYDGAVLVAWGDIQRRYLCHSIRKSFLSALVGIHEGDVDLDRTLQQLGIDDNPPLTDAEKQARVVDLLTATSGIYHPAAYETAKMKEKRPKRGTHRPGDFFYYNNWDFNALSTIFEQETGAGVFEEFRKRFAAPLGMQDFRLQDTYYHREPEHSIHPAYPFRMSARDMARFGLLFLRRGRWRGSEILTEDWVRDSTAPHSLEADNPSSNDYAYGYLWWRIVRGPFEELQMYSARGYGGHSIDVLPAANLVFVHRADTFWDMKLLADRSHTRVRDQERFKLLDLILRARVAAPSARPKLVSLEDRGKSKRVVELDPNVLARYSGDYRFERITVRVKLAGGHLLLGGPDMSDFTLLPQSDTEFIVEDIQVPVTFELDEAETPTAMTIEVAPGNIHHGRRSTDRDPNSESPG